MSGTRTPISQDTVFDLLSSARRRYILYYLRREGGSASINELAAQIAAWENGVAREELTSQDEKRVYVSLYQTHVPKLEDQGIIEYDSQSGEVTLTDRVREIDRYLTTPREEEFPWPVYYLGLAAVAVVILALVALGAPIFVLVPSSALGAVIVFVFAVSAMVHYLTYRRDRGEVPNELMIDE